LCWDWGFRGVPILYSWPSRGTVFSYPRDEESAHLTQASLRLFLQGILAQTAATNVHLIAHSLGCRALAEVLKSFAAEPNPPRFGEVILAAPDINRLDFLRDIAPALPKVARRVTLYASSADRVLHASQSFHQYTRAGDVAGGLTVCQGIETIDASDVDRDLLGHSYLVKSRAVIADSADVICRSLPPEQRNLTRLNDNGCEYWKLNQRVTH
jgi:esterase/lipase superfamily enzyme